ncbi:rhodanese-like domain-containing protein [Thiolinea disciformis]|uniref:rhodanese-like domain-containing protein n=1 Tax=Thiolinea disciformis TaxID=125614 RepID=UPI000360C34B|nr:rhodanese-like domain-containing protein [Thiolinea disciformis]
MNEYLEFAQNHTFLVLGFVAVLGMIIWTEYSRFTQKFKNLDTNQAVQLMNNEQSVIVDVREDNEVKEGKIQGAKHLPLSQFSKRLVELEKSKAKPILVYCRSGNRSAQACSQLVKQGFENVNNLSGGFIAWESANLPVVKR